MTFYTYTIKKMMKSTSTYVTGAIGVALLWIIFITSITHLNSIYVYLSIPYFSMPLFSIFITFKAGQVFREEIENKTLLIIQSKPISRNNMVLQGFLAVITLMGVVSLVGTFLPILIIFIMKGSSLLYIPFLVTLTQLILGSLISIIALQLSLTFKGKAFIGIMVGAFGTGFYVLFGLSAWLKFPNEFKALQYKTMSSSSKTTDGWITLDKNSPYGGQSLDDLYKELDSTNDFKMYDVIKWIDPSTHWGQMFGAGTPTKTEDIVSNFISGRESTISLRNAKHTNGKITSFEVKGGNKESVPLWYSYMLWISIGAALIPLSIRSLSKRNIT